MMMWLNPLEHLEHPIPKAMQTDCIWFLLVIVFVPSDRNAYSELSGKGAEFLHLKGCWCYSKTSMCEHKK